MESSMKQEEEEEEEVSNNDRPATNAEETSCDVDEETAVSESQDEVMSGTAAASSNKLTGSCLPNNVKRAETEDEKNIKEESVTKLIAILHDGVNPTRTKKDDKVPDELPTAALADGDAGKDLKPPKKDDKGATDDPPTVTPTGRMVTRIDDAGGGLSEPALGVELSAADVALNAAGALFRMLEEETAAYPSEDPAIATETEPGAFPQMPGEGSERRTNIANGIEEYQETYHEDMIEQAPSLDREVNQGNDESDTNLSEALMIDDEEDVSLIEAQQAVPEDLHQRRKSREEQERKRKYLLFSLLSFGLLVILALVLLLVFLLPDSSSDTSPSGNKDSNETETPPPSLSPEDVVLQLLPKYTLLELQEKEDTPQAMAYKWIVEDPNLRNYTQERIIQRFALATLYHSTNGPGWANNTNWMSYDHHECQWHTSEFSIFFDLGLFDVWPTFFQEKLQSFLQESPPCGEDPMHPQMYSHLWLFLNNLQGTIPREIFLLTTLKSIWLGPDQITEAVLPPELGELSLLEALSMTAGIESFQDNTAGSESIDKGAGNIPTEIGLLSNLWFLWLTRNRITGTIPTQLGLLSDKLTVLDLGENLLTGGIPTEIGSLENLSSLGLYVNPLSGTIPTELGRLQAVKAVALPASNLQGTIPSELGMLQAVLEINLGINGLTGTVPVELTSS